VKRYAVEHNLPLLQPDKLKDESFIEALRQWKADLQIVIAFRMLPEVVWSMPSLGTFNLHASLLPKYRGAAPINRAVMNGESQTGVTTFLLKHEIDTGDVIQQVAVPIDITDNVGDVHDKLMHLGSKLVIETVDSFINGTVKFIPQDEMLTNGCEPTPAPKIFKEDCRIDWTKSAIEVYNHIRGLSPYPGAWTILSMGDSTEPLQMKIYSTSLPIAFTGNNKIIPGSIVATKHSFMIAAADGFLEIKNLQMPGKKRLYADEFLRGFDVSDKLCL
ncbi:MAG: methionyl-tRNA formyltransferase, partial [Muribaculaceae bacterium]